MFIRSILAAFVAVLISAAWSAPARAQQFDGSWETSYGPMQLAQSGAHVSGTYSYGRVHGTIEGTVSGGRLSYRYSDSTASGEGWFELGNSGAAISGQWRQDGSSRWLNWEGRRVGGQMAHGGGDSDLRASLDAVVASDSQGWMINSYDYGSMTNVSVEDRSSDGRTITVYGEYSYNAGSRGWVRARVVDGAFSCVEYWDFSGRCRPVGTRSYSYQVAGALAVAAMSSAASGGASSGSSNSGRCWNPVYEAYENC